MIPRCQSCRSWNRRTAQYGYCWQEQSPVNVNLDLYPFLVHEGFVCEVFADRLSNRADVITAPIHGPQADGDDGSQAA